MATKLPITWILVFALISITYGLRIGAFNIDRFGEKKSRKQDVLNIIVEIINRYDVILLQEITDSTGKAVENLMNALNRPGSIGFIKEISERFPTKERKGPKEQYLFLIRNDSGLSVNDTHQYNDTGFQRPPFSIRLCSSKTGIKDFALMAIHTTPDPTKVNTTNEIGELATAHSVLQTEWNTSNILIMGDLNAGGAYVRNESLNNLTIRYPPFNWLIDDSVDTTTKSAEPCAFDPNYSARVDDGYNTMPQTRVRSTRYNSRTRKTTKKKKGSSSTCAYDRFIMTGEDFINNLIENSARVFRFDKELVPNLSKDEAQAVSNHYPIELELRDSNGVTPHTSPQRKQPSTPSESNFSRNQRKRPRPVSTNEPGDLVTINPFKRQRTSPLQARRRNVGR